MLGARLPDYRTFVTNLMKTMPTPAEELHHAGTGIAGEGGEILDVTKKVWVYNKPLDVPHLIEELGDLRFYYQAMLNLLGITDDMVIAQNMQKLRVRYADGKYSDAAANARVDKALSAEGSKGTGTPAPRKFMGKVSEEQAAQNIHDQFDKVRNESLRTLRRDEQP
jgi:NTP pyrophosphatase (non-canonical NTP hydrolase)